jgi:DNA mismatch repair protein MutS
MLEQYWLLKKEVPDAILLYRLGDFYEMFFEDAVTAAPLLGLVLTARHRDSDIEAPMCGVPHHALDSYVARLIAAGKKVAISEQTEAAAKGKLLVARKIVRVITPGTLVDPDRLDARRSNELGAFVRDGEAAAFAFLELSTGDFSVVSLPASGCRDYLSRRTPRELLVAAPDEAEARRWAQDLVEPPVLSMMPADAPRGRRAEEFLLRHFKVATLSPFGLDGPGPSVDAAAALLHYARGTQRSDCAHVSSVRLEPESDGLVVDGVTAGHLELFRSQRDGTRSGTLLDVLDRTGTAFGARALRGMLERPLGRRQEIEDRFDAVEELSSGGARLERLAEGLSGIPDLPRLVSRLSVGGGTPRDLAALSQGLLRAAAVSGRLGEPRCSLLRTGGAASPEGFPTALAERVAARIVDEPPLSPRDGGLFRDGVDPELDEWRGLRKDSAAILAALEAEERSSRAIPTLRVKFNQVFGHVFEVPASARGKIPEGALKRQTLSNVERFATAALVEVDEKLRSADARIAERELALFQGLVAEVVSAAPELLAAAGRIGLLDALTSFARVARAAKWVRPAISDEPLLEITDGRHPVVEATRSREPFIPNDTSLGPSSRLLILTGPNMGGKSTFLRQNALAVLLAHAGSFVPAASATIGLCDRIFTRVGASDSLSRGESTFFVEMSETALILRQATSRSLVVLDEVGRGTSTFDGLSLAWAIAEALHDGERGERSGPARILFATHYHELTELALVKDGVRNRTMSVKEWNGEVVFLRKVVDGTADRSYGVQVARLAGIPERVVARAREILQNLERQQLDMGGRPRLAEHPGKKDERVEMQLDLFHGQGEIVLDAIGKLEVERLTPLVALNLLASFQARLKGEA